MSVILGEGLLPYSRRLPVRPSISLRTNGQPILGVSIGTLCRGRLRVVGVGGR